MSSVRIRMRGPLFDGDGGRRAGLEFARDTSDRVAEAANEAVHRNLDGSIRNSTPYYETQITITNLSYTDRSVNDRGVIYGGWLEGVSSRNQTTRFKGYWSFRRATDEIRDRIGELGQQAAQRYAARMNGGR
jgi:hypothetical protein